MSHKPIGPINCNSDMRIGVSRVEHELLDALDGERSAALDRDGFLLTGRTYAALAHERADRALALQAAARLLLAVEQMDASNG